MDIWTLNRYLYICITTASTLWEIWYVKKEQLCTGMRTSRNGVVFYYNIGYCIVGSSRWIWASWWDLQHIYILSARRQRGLTGYCFKYIDRPSCLQTDDMHLLSTRFDLQPDWFAKILLFTLNYINVSYGSSLTLTVPVTTIDALGHFETG